MNHQSIYKLMKQWQNQLQSSLGYDFLVSCVGYHHFYYN